MSWFLKYRPKQIKDLDLTNVRQLLQGMMEQGKMPQTLLFAGPRGVGKTSTARILGAMLNDEQNQALVDHLFFGQKKPSKSQAQFKEPQLDLASAKKIFQGHSYVVQEMDAASHRGIDDIRELKERVILPPQTGKMAVYILDEVHMLTNQAFNALLKLLEEPPPHVIFILATTELHKIPETIVSRCTKISFRRATNKEVVQRLEKNLKAEKIKYELEALEDIALRADGSFRDAVKLAEVAAQSGKITLENLEQTIGQSIQVEVKNLVKAVLAKDDQTLVKILQSLRERHIDQAYFYQTLFNLLHQSLLIDLQVIPGEGVTNKKVAQFLLKQLLQADLDVPCPIPFLSLELKLLELIALSNQKAGGGSAKKQPKKQVKVQEKTQETHSQEKATQPTAERASAAKTTQTSFKVEELEKRLAKQELVTQGSLSQQLCQNWEKLITQVAARNTTLAALLRSGKPVAGDNGTAQINVFYKFHQEQLQQPKFKTIIEQCGQTVVGDKVQFEFVLAKTPQEAELVDVPAETESLETVAEQVLL